MQMTVLDQELQQRFPFKPLGLNFMFQVLYLHHLFLRLFSVCSPFHVA